MDEDFGTNLTLVEGNGGVRLSPVSAPEHAPRAGGHSVSGNGRDAAEARAEGLRWAEVAARSDGGSWKSRKACRRRLSEAVEETKEARRTAGTCRPCRRKWRAWRRSFLKPASRRPSIRPGRCARRTPGCARPWRHKAREGATGPWPAPPRRRTVLPSPDQKETVRSLRTELRRLDKAGGTRRTPAERASTRRRRGRSASGRPRRSCPASPFGSTGR